METIVLFYRRFLIKKNLSERCQVAYLFRQLERVVNIGGTWPIRAPRRRPTNGARITDRRYRKTVKNKASAASVSLKSISCLMSWKRTEIYVRPAPAPSGRYVTLSVAVVARDDATLRSASDSRWRGIWFQLDRAHRDDNAYRSLWLRELHGRMAGGVRVVRGVTDRRRRRPPGVSGTGIGPLCEIPRGETPARWPRLALVESRLARAVVGRTFTDREAKTNNCSHHPPSNVCFSIRTRGGFSPPTPVYYDINIPCF